LREEKKNPIVEKMINCRYKEKMCLQRRGVLWNARKMLNLGREIIPCDGCCEKGILSGKKKKFGLERRNIQKIDRPGLLNK